MSMSYPYNIIIVERCLTITREITQCLVLHRELMNELHIKINKILHNRKIPKSVVLSRFNTVLARGQHTILLPSPL